MSSALSLLVLVLWHHLGLLHIQSGPERPQSGTQIKSAHWRKNLKVGAKRQEVEAALLLGPTGECTSLRVHVCV